jgi:hypothetical protein
LEDKIAGAGATVWRWEEGVFVRFDVNARGLPWWATFEGRAGRGQARTERAYEIRVLEQSPRREIEVSQQPALLPEWSATEMDVDVDGLLVLLLVPLCTNAIW